jgi:hypothetical protein
VLEVKLAASFEKEATQLRRLGKWCYLFLPDRPLPVDTYRQQEETLHDNCILINDEQAQELHVS